MADNIRVTVWNEYQHELRDEVVKGIYPNGIHGAIADFLEAAGYDVKTATLAEPEHGLTRLRRQNRDAG
jgi:trehalose utilization protein